jgi:AcrR family transcriptional regulator
MTKHIRITEQTRLNLMNGFWKLYKSKDVNKITVSEICDIAGYERTTFYRYFIGIPELLNQLEDEIIADIKASIKKNGKSKKGIFFDSFKRFTNKYGEYIVTFHEKGNTSFRLKFKELIMEDVYEYLSFNVEDNKKEFLFEFMFSSLINSYSYWYNHKKDMSLEAFVEFANNILSNGTKSIIRPK